MRAGSATVIAASRPPAGSPSGGTPGHRQNRDLLGDSTRSGNLAHSYESRFGSMTSGELGQSVSVECSPRQRKPTTITLTDPKNPFNRTRRLGKAHDQEDGRAGVSNQLSPENRDPLKQKARSGPGATGSSMEAGTALLPVPRKHSVLDNYLDDMKKTRSSVRTGARMGAPSADLKRINDERVRLPSERRDEMSPRTPGSNSVPVCLRESEKEDNYGWTSRSRPTSVPNYHSGIDLLHHSTDSSQSPCTLKASPERRTMLEELTMGPRKRMVNHPVRQCSDSALSHVMTGSPGSPRSRREIEAIQRFDEVVEHMSVVTLESRRRGLSHKLRNESGVGTGLVAE